MLWVGVGVVPGKGPEGTLRASNVPHPDLGGGVLKCV